MEKHKLIRSTHVMSIMKVVGSPKLTIHFDEYLTPHPYTNSLYYPNIDWEAGAKGLFDALETSAPPELLDCLAVLFDESTTQQCVNAVMGR